MTMPIGLKPYFRAISWLGVLALIGDTALSALFGWTIGLIMVPVLAVISLASGLLLVAALFFDRIGWRPLAIGLAVAWVPIFLFNAWSNMGVATSNRMGEVQLAHAQQKTYAERGNAVKEAKRELALFEKQLATLIERNRPASIDLISFAEKPENEQHLARAARMGLLTASLTALRAQTGKVACADALLAYEMPGGVSQVLNVEVAR